MATTTKICGIDNTITFASDPNAIASITAVGIVNAISVTWSYPTVNSHAVAHIMLFRANSPNANTRTQLGIVKGNRYRDDMTPNESGQTFWYWVQSVSVNGTTGPLVGPASATARAYVDDMLSFLSGQITASQLAQSLRTPINDIPSLRQDLIDETTGRLQALSDMDAALNRLGLDVTTTFAEIATERTTRINGMEVLANQISAVAVSNGQNSAAIINEQNARVTAISAEASARELLGSRMATAEAAIDTERLTRVTQEGALAEQINNVATLAINSFFQPTAPTEAEGRKVGSVWIDTSNNNIAYQWNGTAWIEPQNAVALDAFSAVQSIQTSISNGDFALASDITRVEASVTTLENDVLPSTIDARVQEKLNSQVGFCVVGRLATQSGLVIQPGRPSTQHSHQTREGCEAAGHTWLPLGSISEAVLGTEISTSQGTAKIQQNMVSYSDDLGVLNNEYTVKMEFDDNDNPVIGGFGLAQNGSTGVITAGFDVDAFWIGRDNGRVKPFVVDAVDGTVYMDVARIREATIDTLHLKNNSISKRYHAHHEKCLVCKYKSISSAGQTYRIGNLLILNKNWTILLSNGDHPTDLDPLALPSLWFDLWVDLADTSEYITPTVEGLLTVNFQLGLGSRSSDSYGVSVTVNLGIIYYDTAGNKIAEEIHKLTRLCIPSNIAFDCAYIDTISISDLIEVQTGYNMLLYIDESTVNVSLTPQWDLKDRPHPVDGAIVNWVFFQDMNMQFQVMKR